MPKIIENEQIYPAIMQVVSERGYTGATTKQMADAANISEVTLFRKYGNKAQLVKQAIASIIEKSDFALAAEYTGNVHADLLKIAQAYQDTAVRYGYFFVSLFSEVTRQPELVDSLDGPLNIFRSVSGLITRYQAEGVLQQEPPPFAVAALLGPLMYLSLMSGAIPDNPLPSINLDTHVTRFLAGRST